MKKQAIQSRVKSEQSWGLDGIDKAIKNLKLAKRKIESKKPLPFGERIQGELFTAREDLMYAIDDIITAATFREASDE